MNGRKKNRGYFQVMFPLTFINSRFLFWTIILAINRPIQNNTNDITRTILLRSSGSMLNLLYWFLGECGIINTFFFCCYFQLSFLFLRLLFFILFNFFFILNHTLTTGFKRKLHNYKVTQNISHMRWESRCWWGTTTRIII